MGLQSKANEPKLGLLELNIHGLLATAPTWFQIFATAVMLSKPMQGISVLLASVTAYTKTW